MVRPRDSQRKKVYRAESEWTRLLRLGGQFEQLKMPDIPSIQVWVDNILRSYQWKTHFSKIGYYDEVKVKDGRGRRSACGRMYSISLPVWARDRGVILHELAHSAMARKHPRAATHGPEFCKIFLMLVKRWLGDDAKRELKACMRTKGVKSSVSRASKKNGCRRQLSVAQKAALKKGREALKRKREIERRMAAGRVQE